MNIRPLLPHEVSFTIEAQDEDVPVIGHFSSDEPEKDREMEQDIIHRLHRGDVWAWCTVKVTATWGEFSASDYLGCCSYDSEEDFIKSNDYCESMKSEALDALNLKLKNTFAGIRNLIQN